MCQQTIVLIQGVPEVFSWTDGFKPSQPSGNISEQDILAAATRLERCGCEDEACLLIDCWCAHPDDRAIIKRLMEEAWQKKVN